MSTLTIGRVSATVHLASTAVGVAGRVAGLLRAAAGDRLDAAMRATTLPDGIWCVRRVEAPVQLDLHRPDPALAESWAAAMSAAVARALAGSGADIVHYRCASEAVLDLVSGVSAARLERLWAWDAAGLLEPDDPDPATCPGAALLAVLERHPETAVGAIVAVVASVGVAPLHRALGAGGWAALARLVDGAAAPAGAPLRDRRAEAPVNLVDGQAAVEMLAGRLVAVSRFAAAVRRTRVRPDPTTVAAWARIVAAEVDATAARRPFAPVLLTRVAHLLCDRATPVRTAIHSDPPTGRAGPAGPNAGRGPVQPDADRAPVEPDACRGPAGPATAPRGSARVDERSSVAHRAEPGHRPGARPGGPGPDADPTHPTAWAGVLFLLATAARVSVPERIAVDPVLGARPLPWILRRVAAGLGAPPDDPIAAVFAGEDPARADPWRTDVATPVEDDAVADLVRRWAGATLAAIDPANEDASRMTSVLRRPGVIRWSPGWTELEMPLDSVDLDIRRAGLDLDPGWVPWLGVVVRYRYG
jgi:hypothetical protein